MDILEERSVMIQSISALIPNHEERIQSIQVGHVGYNVGDNVGHVGYMWDIMWDIMWDTMWDIWDILDKMCTFLVNVIL